jgi:hypothetical protein
MKTIVFIFAPIVVERTDIRVPPASPQSEFSGGQKKNGAREELYPFWTWFLPNPLPPPKDHQ